MLSKETALQNNLSKPGICQTLKNNRNNKKYITHGNQRKDLKAIKDTNKRENEKGQREKNNGRERKTMEGNNQKIKRSCEANMEKYIERERIIEWSSIEYKEERKR